MRNKPVAIAAFVAAVSLGVAVAYSVPSAAFADSHEKGEMSNQMKTQKGAQGSKGHQGGMMGGQGGQGGMMGGQGGMMGAMMAHMGKMKGGMMGGQGGMTGGQGHMGGKSAKAYNFNTDDIRKIVAARLVWQGNDRLKVGKVEAAGDDAIVAEIVTVDDSLVYKLKYDRKSGASQPAK